MISPEFLEKMSDLVIVCDDGRRIPCSKFRMAIACDVVRHVIEDCPAMSELPMPGVRSVDIEAAVRVVHGVDIIGTLEKDDADAASRGMDFLGCTAHARYAVICRIWQLVPDMSAVHARLSTFFEVAPLRLPVLKRLLQHDISWEGMRDVICGLPLDAELAGFLVGTLGKIFPIGLVARVVMATLPATTRADVTAMMTILGGGKTSGAGMFWHPDDAADVLGMLKTTFPDNTFFSSMAQAHDVFSRAPSAASTFSGSVISFRDAAAASAMLYSDGTPPRRCINMASWLKVTPIPVLDVVITAARLGAVAGRARGMQVRVMTWSRDTGVVDVEIWGCWTRANSWHPASPVALSQCPHFARGTPADLTVASRALTRADDTALRVDVFFGSESILVHPPL